MSKAFDEIMQGLNEALKYEKGHSGARTKKITVVPVCGLNADQIRELRLTLKLSQKAFSSVLGVSVKSIEAWEAGRNAPRGPALRMMSCLKNDPNFVNRFIQTS